MTHALSITDGTTTISLSSSNCILNNYVPVAPTINDDGSAKAVTETVEFAITGANGAAVQTKQNQIERILQAAIDRTITGKGPRCYLIYQPDGDSAYRSEIVRGVLNPSRNAAQGFMQGIVEYRLSLTRVPFWEGPRTQIPLSNGNGTNNTSGLTIYAHDDSGTGHDCYLQIASTDVIGSQPTPVELQLTNTTGSAQDYRHWYFANNPWSTSLAHIIEGEDRISGYGTIAAQGSASGGNVVTQTGSGWLTFRWYIPSASLNIIRGRWMRIFARWWSIPSAARQVRLRLYEYYGLTQLTPEQITWTTSAGTDIFHDCGALALPPLEYLSGWKDVVLEISVQTSGSETVAIDFLALLPSEDGLFRYVEQPAFTVANGGIMVDDGIEGVTYLNESGLITPVLEPRTGPLLVSPGVAQRLYVLHDGDGGSIAWTLTAKAWYRPRRWTL